MRRLLEEEISKEMTENTEGFSKEYVEWILSAARNVDKEKRQRIRRYTKPVKMDHVLSGEAQLKFDELEKMAFEIIDIIRGNKQTNLPKYIELAKKVKASQLGYRKSGALKNEPKLEMFFPTPVWDVLKNRKFKQLSFNKSDHAYIKKHKHKNSKWLAKRFYTKVIAINRYCRKYKIELPRQFKVWTQEEDEFIRNNTNKSCSWIAKKLNLNVKQVSSHAKYLNVKLNNRSSVPYTPQEDNFIRNNCDKGLTWLSSKMNRSKGAIKQRARRIKVRIKGVRRAQRKFNKREDSFILRKYYIDGPEYISEVLIPSRSTSSIRNRAKKLRKTRKEEFVMP